MRIDERTRADLAATTRFSDVRLVDEIDSTNRLVADLAAQGAPPGLVVAAAHQTAGRGRLGRAWEAPPGSALLASVLLTVADLPPERFHLVTAATGLSAREACATVAGICPDLKWPNDLLVEDRKLAGILAEASGTSVVVGIGLNVSSAPPDAASLEEVAARPVAVEDLLIALLRALDRRLRDWGEVAAEYRRTCATVGRRVRVELPGQLLVGRAQGIDPGGHLIVRPDGGGPDVTVSAGDVIHLRPTL